jgi:2-phosphosulfolactate phosphatase
MSHGREVNVHLTPHLVDPVRLAGGVAVVADILRATTTIVYALGAGCRSVRPVAEVDEARRLAIAQPSDRFLLAGERDGRPLPGFDFGNSPSEFTADRCRGATLLLTTTNGTRALLRAAAAERVLVGSFANFSAVCEQLAREFRPIHVVCAGEVGTFSLEDTLFAGAVVKSVCEIGPARLNDGARVAADSFARCGDNLEAALAVGSGGSRLRELGYDDDIRAAARVDAFALVPELYRDPLRVEVSSVGFETARWQP